MCSSKVKVTIINIGLIQYFAIEGTIMFIMMSCWVLGSLIEIITRHKLLCSEHGGYIYK